MTRTKKISGCTLAIVVSVTSLTLTIVNMTGGNGTTISTPHGDVKACTAAMTVQLDNAWSDPTGGTATKPSACNGLTDTQLEQIATQILAAS